MMTTTMIMMIDNDDDDDDDDDVHWEDAGNHTVLLLPHFSFLPPGLLLTACNAVCELHFAFYFHATEQN